MTSGQIIFTCGKIGCGKTACAKRLCAERGAMLLSADELMLSLFGSDAGEKHDEYLEKVKTCLPNQSLELASRGVNAVLDRGLWARGSWVSWGACFNRLSPEKRTCG